MMGHWLSPRVVEWRCAGNGIARDVPVFHDHELVGVEEVSGRSAGRIISLLEMFKAY